ncbi:hypothetical protein V5P93_006273 [Actinokineospora auranticolor]|uniref:sensor histidine kinase n=1 Tax=Actinokineospora auranticolor TaxID=155976 RepID=UPI000CEC62B0|nr:ATP-binding protein [Actinokineospora auranticolor]
MPGKVPANAPSTPEAGAARVALDRLIARCAAAMRVAVAATGAVAALAGAAPPVRPSWLLPAVALNLVWSAVFAWLAVRRGLRAPVMAADIAVTTLLCAGIPWLVPESLLVGGISWVDELTSMTIIVSSLAWRPRVAVPAGLGLAAAHVLGTWQAGAGAVPGTIGIYLVQITASAALMTLLRHAAALADDALAELRETERAAAVLRARRADERAQNRKLHDTVLATLTTVGTGGITASTPGLRARAAADLLVIENLGELNESGTDVDLRPQLQAAVDSSAVAVDCDLVPCRVPLRVAAAFAEAVAEALTNIARHAGVASARLRQHAERAAVCVVVSDTGAGFDPAEVPLHRYGVREGIVGRMRAVDGDADVSSNSGGTTVTLRWPA